MIPTCLGCGREFGVPHADGCLLVRFVAAHEKLAAAYSKVADVQEEVGKKNVEIMDSAKKNQTELLGIIREHTDKSNDLIGTINRELSEASKANQSSKSGCSTCGAAAGRSCEGWCPDLYKRGA